MLADLPGVSPLRVKEDIAHAYHLYVVRIENGETKREEVFDVLRRQGIGASVHYIPVHLQPYYQQQFGTGRGMCPNAEAAYEQILTLPLFPRMSDADVNHVIQSLKEALVYS